MSGNMPSITKLKSVNMLVVAAVFLTVSWLVVSLRVWVRGYMIRSFGADDWLMIATQVFFTLTCAMIFAISITEITQGLTESASSMILIYMLSIFGLYIIATILFKLSLAVFFLRVLNRRWQRQVIYASAGLYTVVGVAWFFVAVFQCGSPANFVANTSAGKCLSFTTVLAPFNYVHGVLNALTDWVFAIVPIYIVRSTQMSRRDKASVMGIFILGAAGSIASLVRLAYVNVLGVGISKLYVDAPSYAIVSITELGFGITAASMATLRPLSSKLLDKAGISRSSRKRTKTSAKPPSGPGIVMERRINLDYEQDHELGSVTLHKGADSRSDSGAGRVGNVHGNEFVVIVESGLGIRDRPNSMETRDIPDSRDEVSTKQDVHLHSSSSSEASLLYTDRSGAKELSHCKH